MSEYTFAELFAQPAPPQNFRLAGLNPNDTKTAPADASGSNQTVTIGQLGAGASADIARIFTAGHSYPAGNQNNEDGERYPARAAAAMHAEDVTYAVTGAVLAEDNGGSNPGGYAAVLNALTPRVPSAGTYSVRNAAPYEPLSPVAVLHYGFNDLAYLTATTATNVAWFKMALRACACVARAGGWFPDTDSSVAYGGSGGSHWTANTGVANYGWPTNHQTTTLNDTVTITVPATFPGGEIDLITLAYAGGTQWSTVVDGGAAQVLNGLNSAYGSNSGHANIVVQRLTGLAAGAHTIVTTVKALDAGASAFFQGWIITAPSLPLVVLPNQPMIPALPYAPGGSPAHTPVTGSDITALNAAIAALPAEFPDGNVVLADIATAFANAGGNVVSTSPGSLYASDGLHPNANGHALIASVVRDAIRSAPQPGWARTSPESIVMRQVGGPLEPAFATGWSSLGFAWFGKDSAGNTWLQLKIQNTSSPGPGNTIFILPPGYQPSVQVLAYGAAWAAGFASVGAAALGIQPSGAVQWFTGTPATELDVTCVFPANGLGS